MKLYTIKKALLHRFLQLITNKKTIADVFNDYFIIVGRIMHDRLPLHSMQITESSRSIQNTFNLTSTTEGEIAFRIRGLKCNNSTKDYISSNACNVHIHHCFMR